MQMTNKERGNWGEALAADFLMAQGYTILRRQYRAFSAELDLICQDPETQELVFVEVKTRKGDIFGLPEDAISKAKIRHLVRAAEAYLFSTDQIHLPSRFDVVAILFDENTHQITHLKDAFWAN